MVSFNSTSPRDTIARRDARRPLRGNGRKARADRARQFTSAIEGLEHRRMLASQLVQSTTGPTNQTTADNYYTQTLGAGFVLLQNQTVSVPAFDTLGGTRVLTGVRVEYRVDLIQEFLDYDFIGPAATNFTVTPGINFVNNDPFSSVTLSGSANATAALSITEPGLTNVDIPTLNTTTAVAVDSDPITPGNQPFVVGPAIAVGNPTSGTFLGRASDSNPNPDLTTVPPNEGSKQFSVINFGPADTTQLAAFISNPGDTTVSFGLGVTGNTALQIAGSANFVQNGALSTVERGEVRVTYFFGTPAARISIGPNDVNAVGDSHTFTAFVEADDGLAIGEPGGDAFNGFAPASGALVDFTLDGTNGAIPDVSAPVNLAPADPSVVNNVATNAGGNAAVTFTSASAGLVAGSAVADLTILGLPVQVVTNGLAGNSGPAVKRFVDARIEIGPDGTNNVNDPHTFTVTVRQDDGLSAAQGGDGVTGFTTVGAGVPVSVTLTNVGGAVANPAGPFNSVTNASGQFAVTFTSATAGQTIGHAATDVSFARLPSEQPPATPITVHRETDGLAGNSDDAVKTWVVPPPPGGEGLTPGFWKNHTSLWVGLSPNQTVASVFGPITHLYGIGNATLLQALSFSNGTLGSGQLVRHAIAGILNANHPLVDYNLTTPQIIAGVQAALLTFNKGIIQALKDQFEDFNEQGGGIDAHGNPI